MRLPAFFVYRRDATGTRSANSILPCATAASRTSAAPARTAVIDLKEPYTPAGICHPLRAHSLNRSAAGPLSTRRSGDRLHLSAISGGSVRSQERSRGKRAGRSKKQGAFVGKCGENHGKRGAFSRRCVAYVGAQADTRATIAQARKNGPPSSFRGRGRTDLYRDTAHDGSGFS